MSDLATAAEEAAITLADLKASIARARAAGTSLRDIATIATAAGLRISHTTVAEWVREFGPVGPDAEVEVVRPQQGLRVTGHRAQKPIYRFTAERTAAGPNLRAEVVLDTDVVHKPGVWADPLTREQLRALTVAVLADRVHARGTIYGAYTPGTHSHGNPWCPDPDCDSEVIVTALGCVEDGPVFELATCCGWEWR